MSIFDDSGADPDEVAAQLEHADRLITELMDRVDALEAELAPLALRRPRRRGDRIGRGSPDERRRGAVTATDDRPLRRSPCAGFVWRSGGDPRDPVRFRRTGPA